MSKKPLCVAFLWHMHQPDYFNKKTGEYYLPWTRLHAVKDYYDMGALVAQVPGMHLAFNIVPSLIDQLILYGQGTAREIHASLTLRDAADLDEGEKVFLLRNFFQLGWKHMLFPYARYKELLERRGRQSERGEYPDGLANYTTQDFRDLQVWFNLSWCGSELRRDPEISALFTKGSGFTEEEKKRLLRLQYSFIGRILPFYRKLSQENGVEFSVTPYYHPILPLLCDSRSASEAQPEIALPAMPFSFPDDAREQIGRAQTRYQEIFGRSPNGMWPSEGSISDASLELAREAGVMWLASDEGVLANSLQKRGRWNGSLPPEQKYSAQRWGPGTEGPCLFFRDRGLSDRVGFTYSSWDPREAAADFLTGLWEIRGSLPDNGRHYIVPVILDGENAWEHYPGNGTEFLLSLYQLLTSAKEFRTVGFSEFLDLEPHREQLDSVVAGSWIYGNLATWIGHPEKNRAWEELAAARSLLQSSQASAYEKTMCEAALQEMLVAEGSDWFWWYGDDHQTENAAEFDALFRNRIKNVYRLLGQPYPAVLDLPIKRADDMTHYGEPVHTITPRLDGRVSDYFEWLAAGFASPVGGDSMHRTERQIEKVFFGYDDSRFYLRMDLRDLREGKFPPEWSLQLHFQDPSECLIAIGRDEQSRWQCEAVGSAVPSLPADLGVDRIVEVGIPLEALGIVKHGEVRFFVALSERGRELERFPANGSLGVTVDPWELDKQERLSD